MHFATVAETPIRRASTRYLMIDEAPLDLALAQCTDTVVAVLRRDTTRGDRAARAVVTGFTTPVETEAVLRDAVVAADVVAVTTSVGRSARRIDHIVARFEALLATAEPPDQVVRDSGPDESAETEVR